MLHLSLLPLSGAPSGEQGRNLDRHNVYFTRERQPSSQRGPLKSPPWNDNSPPSLHFPRPIPSLGLVYSARVCTHVSLMVSEPDDKKCFNYARTLVATRFDLHGHQGPVFTGQGSVAHRLKMLKTRRISGRLAGAVSGLLRPPAVISGALGLPGGVCLQALKTSFHFFGICLCYGNQAASMPVAAQRCESYKGHNGTHYKSAIAATRRALNWRAVFSSKIIFTACEGNCGSTIASSYVVRCLFTGEHTRYMIPITLRRTSSAGLAGHSKAVHDQLSTFESLALDLIRGGIATYTANSNRRRHKMTSLVRENAELPFANQLTPLTPSELPPRETGYRFPGGGGGVVAPGFSYVGLVPVFSGFSRFPRPLIPAQLNTHYASLTEYSSASCKASLTKCVKSDQTGEGEAFASMKQRRNAGSENPPTSDIVRHDTHVRKSRSDATGIRTPFALIGGEQANRSATEAPIAVRQSAPYNLYSSRRQVRSQFLTHPISAWAANQQRNRHSISLLYTYPFCDIATGPRWNGVLSNSPLT
ncbi:hypothetical protein PR048_030790 [Dryococelus australis]|uniref:Uncharacterized protein n=1 Tax=Dryococelus australis TaxID=614101 RepID=A0ABQ9GCQ3_9NEOP|nr:hypothetical protein PR048_030790 [Dryococelus australis]